MRACFFIAQLWAHRILPVPPPVAGACLTKGPMCERTSRGLDRQTARRRWKHTPTKAAPACCSPQEPQFLFFTQGGAADCEADVGRSAIRQAAAAWGRPTAPGCMGTWSPGPPESLALGPSWGMPAHPFSSHLPLQVVKRNYLAHCAAHAHTSTAEWFWSAHMRAVNQLQWPPATPAPPTRSPWQAVSVALQKVLVYPGLALTGGGSQETGNPPLNLGRDEACSDSFYRDLEASLWSPTVSDPYLWSPTVYSHPYWTDAAT